MNKHTPGPWIVRGKPGNRFIRTEIIGGKATTVAWIDSLDAETELPNAEFIVLACNSHYDLLAALEATINAMVMQIKREREEFHISAEAAMAIWDEAICLGNAAIAKAKGTS